MELNTVLASVLGAAIGGGGVAVYRKAGTERESIAVGTLRGIIAELRSELERKEKEIQAMRSRLEDASKWLDDLGWPDPHHIHPGDASV